MFKPLLSAFFFLSLYSIASAAPALIQSSVIRRTPVTLEEFGEFSEVNDSNKSDLSGPSNKAAFNGPVTVTTVTTTNTNVGTVTQTCQITLTAIQVNGQDAVREDKKCKETVSSSNGNTNSNTGSNNNNNNGGSSSSTTTPPLNVGSNGNNNNNNNGGQQATATNVISPSDVSVIGAGTASASNSQATTPTGTSNTGTNNGNNAPPNVSVIGMTTVTGTASGSIASVTAGASIANGVASPPNVSVVGQSSVQATGVVPAADQSSASPAAAQASTTGFTIPGRTLQVLPIGLGVFAGISVIALIVVGLVTYERTKYRKTFRKRKMAEAAAPMGYGGMAERS